MIPKSVHKPLKSQRPAYRPKIKASSHYVVRCLERVYNINLEPIRQWIVNSEKGDGTDGDIMNFLRDYGKIDLEKLKKALMPDWILTAAAMGATKVPSSNGFIYILSQGTLITVVKKN